MKNEVESNRVADALTRLAEAQIANDRRTARLERIVRWGAIGLVAIAVTTLAVINDTIGEVFAAPGEAELGQDPASVVQALNAINQNLAVMGQIGQMMQAGMKAATEDAAIQPYIKKYLDKHPDLPPEKATQQALMQAAGETLAGAFVVMHRLREDSDLIREMITKQKLHATMGSIRQELRMMNAALAAVPHMAANMNTMGYNMGKMGSWVPWAGW